MEKYKIQYHVVVMVDVDDPENRVPCQEYIKAKLSKMCPDLIVKDTGEGIFIIDSKVYVKMTQKKADKWSLNLKKFGGWSSSAINTYLIAPDGTDHRAYWLDDHYTIYVGEESEPQYVYPDQIV